jgi:hypothetical protein
MRAGIEIAGCAPTEAPPGLIRVPLKGAVLLLTEPEYLAGIRRGKAWRRQVARGKRAEKSSRASSNPRPAPECPGFPHVAVATPGILDDRERVARVVATPGRLWLDDR